MNYGAHEMKFACMERSRMVCAEHPKKYAHGSHFILFWAPAEFNNTLASRGPAHDCPSVTEASQSIPDSEVHVTNMGPIWVGPKWAPCWPHEPCYQGC